MTDDELVERARGGDLDAYDVLVARYQGIAHRAAALFVGPSDADDVTQEAFVKAYRALPRFRPGAPLRPWLLRIVTNEARNRRRAAGRRERIALRAGFERAPTPATPEEHALRAEQLQRLLDAVEELDDAQRAVVVCRWFLELSEAETATVLDCPLGSVKSRHARALARLQAALTVETVDD